MKLTCAAWKDTAETVEIGTLSGLEWGCFEDD